MTGPGEVIPAVIPPSRRLIRVAVWCAYSSGVVSIFGIVFLIVFFTTFIGPFGTLNDIAVVIQYVLMLPIAVALHQILRPLAPARSLVTLLLGITGMLWVIVIQMLFLTDVLPYAPYIVLVSAGFFVVLAWFMIIRNQGRLTRKLPSSVLLYILAGLYFGYPVWAFLLGRQLRTFEENTI